MSKPTSEIKPVIVEVRELKNNCPVYNIGDRIYIVSVPGGGWAIDTRRSAEKICLSTLPNLVGEIVKVRHCIRDRIFVRCLDPGPPYTENSVIFEIKRQE